MSSSKVRVGVGSSCLPCLMAVSPSIRPDPATSTCFDVTRSSKVVEYVHLDLAGEPKVEDREVVSETIESVRCRWCNAVDQVELVDRPGAGS